MATDLGLALEHARLFTATVAAVERLQALDRSRDVFMSTVSHELRTPLTSISGYLELLEDGVGQGLSDEQTHVLGVIRRNGDRLQQLIEDLLTLSRIESGALRTMLGDVDLAAMVRGVVEDLGPAAIDARIDLTADVGAQALHVAGDAGQLSRALLNLANNGIKFTPAGGSVQLSMRVEPDADGTKDRAVLEVKDTGMGIPPEDQQALFTRFFRASNATSANVPGTGLGLVIVRNIVENHGGTVQLESTPGRGTTVRMELPLVSVDAPAADATPTRTEPAS